VISPDAKPLPTQNKRGQASMPPVGFKHTIPVFEWTEIFHALGRDAAVIGTLFFEISKSFSTSFYMFWFGGVQIFLPMIKGATDYKSVGRTELQYIPHSKQDSNYEPE
jgi:hypothetical protein